MQPQDGDTKALVSNQKSLDDGSSAVYSWMKLDVIIAKAIESSCRLRTLTQNACSP